MISFLEFIVEDCLPDDQWKKISKSRYNELLSQHTSDPITHTFMDGTEAVNHSTEGVPGIYHVKHIHKPHSFYIEIGK